MPNVGKSSMMNNLLKEEKSIVTNIAGTTRDSVDSYIKYFDNSFRLIDTAGLRKKTKIEDALEFYSFVRTNRVIEECDIAAILIDANKGFHAQDKNIINYIIKKGKGLLIVVNKWDLIEKDTMTMKNFSDDIIYEYPILANFPIVFVSVKNNLRVTKVMKIALEIFHNLNKKIKTNNLNIFLKKILNHYPPPSVKGKEINIKLLSQLNTKPPIFGFFTSNPSLIPESYKRYLANQIYKKFNFHGVPIKISFKQK
jgi:GTP-binding protein